MRSLQAGWSRLTITNTGIRLSNCFIHYWACLSSSSELGEAYSNEKMFALLEKCFGCSLKQLDKVQKFWAPLRKLFAARLVPICLRACLSSLHVSFKPSCYKTSKTPNNVCNAMDPNSVIKFFVIATLLEALRKKSISQVQVENTRSYFLRAILTLFNNFFYANASALVNTDTERPGGGEKTLRSSCLPPPGHPVWVVADGMTEVSFRRLPTLLCLYC